MCGGFRGVGGHVDLLIYCGTGCGTSKLRWRMLSGVCSEVGYFRFVYYIISHGEWDLMGCRGCRG